LKPYGQGYLPPASYKSSRTL